MTDDVLARARELLIGRRGEVVEVVNDLIALAESQAKTLAEIRALAKSATEQDMFGLGFIHATRILAILDGGN